MTTKSTLATSSSSIAVTLLSITFGIAVMIVGLINTFWGNDTGFGIFLILLSLVFFPSFNGLFRKIAGFTIPWFVKILLALFIVWVSLGVGELFAKIELMMKDFG